MSPILLRGGDRNSFCGSGRPVMAKLIQLVVDRERPAALARFWAEALDDFEILPYHDDEVARLASLGLGPETDPTVILVARASSCAPNRSTWSTSRRSRCTWT
jgi:hypothetical protein